MSSNLVQPSVFLRRVLWADAGVSAVVGAVMAAGAGPLQRLTGLPPGLLVSAGLALFPYAAYLVWIASRRAVPRAAVWVPIVANVLWAIDCAWVGLSGRFDLHGLGELFLVMHVVTVLVFAELEFIGLTRAPRLAA